MESSLKTFASCQGDDKEKKKNDNCEAFCVSRKCS